MSVIEAADLTIEILQKEIKRLKRQNEKLRETLSDVSYYAYSNAEGIFPLTTKKGYRDIVERCGKYFEFYKAGE